MNAETKEMRMLLLASISPALLQNYIQSESELSVSDHNSFPGESITFSPSKEELSNAHKASILMRKADSIAESKPKKAIELYKDALTHNPYDPLLLMSIGVSEYRVGKREDAVATLKKAYNMAPDGYREKSRIKKNLDALISRKSGCLGTVFFLILLTIILIWLGV